MGRYYSIPMLSRSFVWRLLEWKQGDQRVTTILLLALVLSTALYSAFAFSPSSYAITMRLIKAPASGIVIGEPRPIRSDEWAVWTPYMQATVRNHFQRINNTSFYREDLRNINALPLLDWG